jgi:nucleoside-diphosphate-sugar epimerase
MRIFLAGATGVIGRRLCVLLRNKAHEVVGTTRSPEKASLLRALGVTPIVFDVLEAEAVTEAVRTARPEIIIHQLTDLASPPGTPGYGAAQQANRRLRIDGTRNLMRAARTAGVARVIAQSIAFIYAPGGGMRDENDPLDLAGDGVRQLTVQGAVALEREVLQQSDITGIILRYGYFYGPGCWYDAPPKPPSVHVDAAAHAASLAVSKGVGLYNIAEDDGAVSSAKAIRELGFDPAFRLSEQLLRR